ncbi:MAG TPA: thiamine phosphate synthase [Longimicrobiales bacterium]
MMLPRLHLVTADEVLLATDFADRAGRVLAACGAAVALHLRGHGLSGRELYVLAERLRGVAGRVGAALLVNDRIDVALAAGADGVQLGRRSLPVPDARRLLGSAARIGFSAHSVAEAAGAERDGADFVVLGAVYPTASHPGEPGCGVGRVREAVEAVGVPVLAIGGITPERVGAVRAAGAYGVAVLGGVWRAADPAAAARAYLEALEEGVT